MTPEEAFTVLRSMAEHQRSDRFAQQMALKAVKTLEDFVSAQRTLDEAARRRALARAATKSIVHDAVMKTRESMRNDSAGRSD